MRNMRPSGFPKPVPPDMLNCPSISLLTGSASMPIGVTTPVSIGERATDSAYSIGSCEPCTAERQASARP